MAEFPIHLPVIREPDLTGCTLRFKLESPTFAVAVVVDEQEFSRGVKKAKQFLDEMPTDTLQRLLGVLQLAANVYFGISEPPISVEQEQPATPEFEPGDRVRVVGDQSKVGTVVESVGPVMGQMLFKVKIDDGIEIEGLPDDRLVLVSGVNLELHEDADQPESPAE